MSAEMDALVNGVMNKLEALETGLQGMKEVHGRFTDEEGLVTAEVNGEGELVALRLSEAVTNLSPAETSEMIIWVCQQATLVAQEQRSNVLASLNESFAVEASGASGQSGDRVG